MCEGHNEREEYQTMGGIATNERKGGREVGRRRARDRVCRERGARDGGMQGLER